MRAWFLPLILVLGIANPALGQDFDPKMIYQKASKAVVLIAAFSQGDDSGSTGTGSIIQGDGLVLTNAHVVVNEETNKPYKLIRVFLKPDRVTGNLVNDTSRKFKATLVNYSSNLDLAILKIEESQFPSPLPHLKFSDLTQTSIGDPVLAIGHPEKGGLWTLTTGTISSLIENFGNPGKDVFQTETSINRGNSGGPLIDRHGLIVGINSMIARQGEGGLTITDINFSVKSTVAVKWMSSIGYSHNYSIPQTPALPGNTPTDNVGIVPVPKQKPGPPEVEPEPKPSVEPKILTEIRPYKERDLVQLVEDEMEEMMEEMKGKIRSR